MARRAIAVVSACLFTAGAVHALAVPAAAATETAEASAVPEASESAGTPAKASGLIETPAVASGEAEANAVPEGSVAAGVSGVAVCHAGARVVTPERGAEPYAPSPAQAAEMLADLRRRLSRARRGSPTPITVPTWVHVTTDGLLGAQDSAVRAQIAALNAAYGGQYGGADTGVRFRLEGITRTDDPAMFRNPLGFERSMKQMRRGGAETLNLYVAQLGELVLGYSTYPYWYGGEPQLDGVVVDWRTLPGGSLRNFDRGFTAVHEIGHWLGLLHTFENGCEPPGDAVADTPPEGVPTEGCPTRKDTCRGGGSDPIHNFMDYAQDRCMSEFTAGQAVRMHEMWAAYRGVRPALPLTGDSTEDA
ncbi:zinc metalloprotease [Streptosporangium carneum]|uniref:Zinc metalloprotease n=1 Tax=Streptosporangium carneum TaxID=47481 RepID=A0A9W6HZ68_9ACTN|nr:zinc metalloprotease [Streptosporangium carneum]GLK08045.1 zinc metalloprotease [Streptosporangium carneum]